MGSNDDPGSTDHRSHRTVLVGACLLDQNRRFPGIAVESGVCRGLTRMLIDTGVGIHALPCPECLAWGGVRRRRLFHSLPLLYRTAGTPFYPLVRIVGRGALAWYAWRCRRIARRVVDRVVDCGAAGDVTVGAVLMNDSPTCGVTRTLDLLAFVPEFKRRGYSLEDLLHPTHAVLSVVIPEMLDDGSGVFASALEAEATRRGIHLPLVGYDPWLDIEAEGAEVARVSAALGG